MKRENWNVKNYGFIQQCIYSIAALGFAKSQSTFTLVIY